MAQISEANRNSILREYASRSLAGFARVFWRTLEPSAELKWGWALDAVCQHLEAVSRGEITRLVINIPPGSMKSLLVSVMWPAWEWCVINPGMSFVSTANNQQLSMRDARRMRLLVTSEIFRKLFPEIILTADQAAKTNFENTLRGRRNSVAYSGITGFRGDRVIIDDPIPVKGNDADAKRLEANLLFREAVQSRVNNERSAIVMIMQRIHEEDPAAIAMELGYERLIIPAVYEGANYDTARFTDPRKNMGESFFPERFSIESLAQIQRALGPYAWSAQFQQNPAPRGDGIFPVSKLGYVDDVPDGLRFVRGWDIAATAGAGDFTAGVKLAVHDGWTYIVDVVHGQWDAHTVAQKMRAIAMDDGIRCKQSIPQDPGSAGKAFSGALVRNLSGVPVASSPETGDKTTRAMPLASQVQAGNVRILRAPWNDRFVQEMATFPVGKHDDQIDAASRAYNDATSGLQFDIHKLL